MEKITKNFRSIDEVRGIDPDHLPPCVVSTARDGEMLYTRLLHLPFCNFAGERTSGSNTLADVLAHFLQVGKYCPLFLVDKISTQKSLRLAKFSPHKF